VYNLQHIAQQSLFSTSVDLVNSHGGNTRSVSETLNMQVAIGLGLVDSDPTSLQAIAAASKSTTAD
jgi:hypothetical protein